MGSSTDMPCQELVELTDPFGPATRKGIGHDLDPTPETTAHGLHGGLDIGLATPATARGGSSPPEVRLCRPPLSSRQRAPREREREHHRAASLLAVFVADDGANLTVNTQR